MHELGSLIIAAFVFWTVLKSGERSPRKKKTNGKVTKSSNTNGQFNTGPRA